MSVFTLFPFTKISTIDVEVVLQLQLPQFQKVGTLCKI